MLALLDTYDTPEIPPEEQKKGMRGWIIEWSGTFLRENGYSYDSRGVCTRQIILEADTKPDRKAYDRWFQAGRTLKAPYHGWYGPFHRIFKQRPTWSDRLKYMSGIRERDDPEKVEYYEIIGNWDRVKHEY